MITFQYEDIGSGIIGKIRVGFDGPSGKFFQILITDMEEKARFIEELKLLDEMLSKNTTILPGWADEKCARLRQSDPHDHSVGPEYYTRSLDRQRFLGGDV